MRLTSTFPQAERFEQSHPPFLLATKLEAFESRGKGDFYGSRDFQDIIVLIDGREELQDEVNDAPDKLRAFVAGRFEQLARNQAFDSGIQGALLPGPETQERAELVVKRRIREMTRTAVPQPEGSSRTEGLR
jgi:hypothetical protein